MDDDDIEGNLNPGILTKSFCSCVLMTFLLTRSWIILTFLLRIFAKSFGGILSLNTFLTAVGATYWINIFRIQKFRSSLEIVEALSAIITSSSKGRSNLLGKDLKKNYVYGHQIIISVSTRMNKWPFCYALKILYNSLIGS